MDFHSSMIQYWFCEVFCAFVFAPTWNKNDVFILQRLLRVHFEPNLHFMSRVFLCWKLLLWFNMLELFYWLFLAGCGRGSNLISFLSSRLWSFFSGEMCWKFIWRGNQQPCFRSLPTMSFPKAIENPNKSLERKTFFKFRGHRCVPKLFPFVPVDNFTSAHSKQPASCTKNPGRYKQGKVLTWKGIKDDEGSRGGLRRKD